MPSPRWRKILRDLWGNKARTILVVLSIAVGVFSVGATVGTQVVMTREMNNSWASANPPSASLYTGIFDEELIWTVRNMPGIEEVDARRGITLRFKMDLGDTQWRRLNLYTYPDYEDIGVFKLRSESGAWPPPERELVVERASLDWMGARVGDMVYVEARNGQIREMRLAGTLHDLSQMDASWTGQAAGYVSPHSLEWLGMVEGFDELSFIVSDSPGDVEHIKGVAQNVRDKVEKGGQTVYYTWIAPPGRHPADETLQPIFLILSAIGFLSLFASGFLVINTLQALLAQQVRQIGIMKAIGARNGQIMGVYYAMVLLFSFLALAIAVPLGALAAHAFTNYVADLVNFDVTIFQLPTQVLLLEIGIGLVIPILAAFVPIISAVRVTARDAMSDFGLGQNRFGQGRLDRMLNRVRTLSRPVLLSLRNTFRRKGRLCLTLATLTLGGAIFIAVLTVRTSLLLTLDETYKYVEYDVYTVFRRGYRADQIEREAMRVPGVVAAEAWRSNMARRQRPDGTESEPIVVRAPQSNSDFVNPMIEEGRWLVPEDQNAIVLNTFLLKDDPDIRVGDDVTLKIEGRESSWRVVGLIKGTPPIAMGYVNIDYFTRIAGGVGRAGLLFVQTEQHDPGFQAQVEEALEAHFNGIGLWVNSTMTESTERSQIASQFNVLVIFLLIMAVLLAFVGGIGLMGTMSLNVLERTREIGVMRAIGASDGAILQMVIIEGILIGVISWILGTIIALPLSTVLSSAIGFTVFKAALSYSFAMDGVALWLVVILILAAAASAWPARNASRVTVREVLAYE